MIWHVLIHILRDNVWQGLEFFLTLIAIVVTTVKHNGKDAS